MAPRRWKVSRKSVKKSSRKTFNRRKRGVQKRYKFVKRGVRRFARRASSRYGLDFLEPYLYDPTVVLFDSDMPRLIDSDGSEDVNASLPGVAVMVGSNDGVVIPPPRAAQPITHRTVSNRWNDDEDIPNVGVANGRETMDTDESPRYNLRSNMVVVRAVTSGIPTNYNHPAEWKKEYKKTEAWNSLVTDLAVNADPSTSYFQDRLNAIYREQDLDPINHPMFLDNIHRTTQGFRTGRRDNGTLLADMAWLELSRLHYWKKRAVSNVSLPDGGSRKNLKK